ncbi:rod shape-determining protein MreD [Amphibacillus indicireducens]|uniref:Rod shape-determining protein MreD n=1 Tax=Amphibacillus indicireducens TaxID=1076330 RepID=A0ABP7VDG3_9BACI
MSRIYLPLILALLIILQGATANLIPASFDAAGWIVVIHGCFLFLVLIKLFYDLETTYYALLAALFVGLIIDIIYTDIIGVYMFSYALMIYFVHGMRKILQTNFYVATLLTAVSLGLVDSLLYFIYHFIGVTQMEMSDYFYYRLMPTVAINLILFFVLYLLFRKTLIKWSDERFDLEKSTN